jgi:hypothetical protein
MIIIGVDFHPGFQQVAFVDNESGEFQEKRLSPSRGGGEFLSCFGEHRPEGTSRDLSPTRSNLP